MIEEGRGNLLEADVDALVNTVNTVGIMGKGIALQFKRAFPLNFQSYADACARGEVDLGRMFVYETGTLEKPRFIINFPTKGHWRSKSKIDEIRRGLADLRSVIADRRIRSIALPPLGCGNGGLEWAEVYPIIREELAPLDDVVVLVFPPVGPPAPENMPDRTERPAMTSFSAALILAFNRYLGESSRSDLSDDGRMSIVEAQKVAYFLQVAGQSLGLVFAPSHFGPYSHTVDRFICKVEGHFITGYGDGSSGSKATLRLDGGAVEQAEHVMGADPDFHAVLDRLVEILDGFEFPYGIELLSTVHYVIAERGGSIDIDSIVREIRSWSNRKGVIFQEQQVRLAHGHLAEVALTAPASVA